MYEAVGMYLLIKAEHEEVLREFAERERVRRFPRAASSRRRPLRAVTTWARQLLQPAQTYAATPAGSRSS